MRTRGAGHVHDARAKRPSATPSKSASSRTPAPTSQSATPPAPVKSTKATNAGKNTAAKTLGAKLGTFVSEQRIVAPCYALIPLSDAQAKNKRRYDLFVEIKTKTTPGGDPDDFKGRIGDCSLDYLIIDAPPK